MERGSVDKKEGEERKEEIHFLPHSLPLLLVFSDLLAVLFHSRAIGNYQENQLKEKALHFTNRIEAKNDMKVPDLWGLAKRYTCVPLTSNCSK